MALVCGTVKAYLGWPTSPSHIDGPLAEMTVSQYAGRIASFRFAWPDRPCSAQTGGEDPMAPTYTEVDFDELSWHDCSIWGIALRTGEASAFQPADLMFDIDFIVEWVCAVGAPARFRVAPAALVFHNVTDLRIEVQTTHSGDYRMALSPWPILGISRQPIERPVGYPGPPSYTWTLALGIPSLGEIHFGASGFTQELRAEPVLTGQQNLTIAERARPPT